MSCLDGVNQILRLLIDVPGPNGKLDAQPFDGQLKADRDTDVTAGPRILQKNDVVGKIFLELVQVSWTLRGVAAGTVMRRP